MRLGLLESYDLSFEIVNSTLQGLLRQVAPVIPTKDTLPALTNFYITATSNLLGVTGTDLSAVILVSTSEVEVDSPGKALLPARLLQSICSELPNDAKMTICVFEDKAWVGADGPVGPVEWEFPIHKLSTFPTIDVKADYKWVSKLEFEAAVESVKVAVSKDSLRPVGLMSISVSGNTMTACDGVRLHQVQLESEMPFDFNLPGAKVDLVLKTLASAGNVPLHIGENEKYLVFTCAKRLLAISKSNVVFPSVEKVLLRPALENNQELIVNREEMVKAVKQVRLVSEQESCSVVLSLTPGVMELSSKDRTGRRATATIRVTWGGPDTTLVFHHRQLLETLKSHTSEQCVILLGVDTKLRKTPLLIKNAGLTTILQQLAGEV